ncbi:hypothetical protein [Nonomuraea sp. NPDC049784]|uniref:hypothetical protein n=1 Tax=Nonomuraea sp. NPDC049784 TaxID=3154361 RepID=UPI003406C373
MTVEDIVNLAEDAEEALAFLRVAGLGQDPWGDVDRSQLLPPDPTALLLMNLVPADDESTAVELLIAAGYDYTYASSLIARFPGLAPNPELVRRLLADAGIPETAEADL